MANPKLKSSLFGRWHIVSMAGRSPNEESGSFIEFRDDGYGKFHFSCVQAEFDYRTRHQNGIRVAQFNWAGNELEGIGWAMVQSDEMSGTICVIPGDKFEFVAKRIGPSPDDADDQDELTLGKGAAFVKSRLKYLPQENDTWEVDFELLSKVVTKTDSEYVGFVVTQPERFLVANCAVEQSPDVNDLATLLAHAMNRPLIEGGHRPSKIVLRTNPRWQPLFRHLREIGIEVAVQDELPMIAKEVKEYLRHMNRVRPSLEKRLKKECRQ